MRFNKADYENWVLRPVWSLEEGIQLLLGIEPIHNVVGSLRRIQGADGFKQEIITRLDIGERSIKAGTLKVDGDYHPAHWACELYPTTFLKWAKSNGWEIPDELTGLLNIPEPDPVEEKREATVREVKPRNSQIAKAVCQGIAKTLWEANPDMTIADMLKRDEVLEYGGAKYYNLEKTVRPWLSKVDPRLPEKKTGRPKGK